MREVDSKENKPVKPVVNKRKKAVIIIVSIVMLLILFFVSFIVTYNIMTKNSKSSDVQQLGASDTKLDENKQLKEKISALEIEVEELKAQVDKYKSIAGASAIPVVKPSPKPTAKPSPSPSPTQSTESYSTKTPAPTKTPVPTKTPAPSAAPIASPEASNILGQ